MHTARSRSIRGVQHAADSSVACVVVDVAARTGKSALHSGLDVAPHISSSSPGSFTGLTPSPFPTCFYGPGVTIRSLPSSFSNSALIPFVIRRRPYVHSYFLRSNGASCCAPTLFERRRCHPRYPSCQNRSVCALSDHVAPLHRSMGGLAHAVSRCHTVDPSEFLRSLPWFDVDDRYNDCAVCTRYLRRYGGRVW